MFRGTLSEGNTLRWSPSLKLSKQWLSSYERSKIHQNIIIITIIVITMRQTTHRRIQVYPHSSTLICTYPPRPAFSSTFTNHRAEHPRVHNAHITVDFVDLLQSRYTNIRSVFIIPGQRNLFHWDRALAFQMCLPRKITRRGGRTRRVQLVASMANVSVQVCCTRHPPRDVLG